MDQDETPRNIVPNVFISYSWEVKGEVLKLAERLRADGVNAFIDVWDLREGQDMYKFMERMVSDPTIEKVLIICDHTYQSKSDNRHGGAGEEASIISPEVYKQADQQKFIPIVLEKDSNGDPCTPHYIKSRIYIDLSSENLYEKEYDKLLHNLYNKPMYEKPPLGKQPSWLNKKQIVPFYSAYMVHENQKSINHFSIGHFKDSFLSDLKNAGDMVTSAENLIASIDATKPLRDLYIDFIVSTIEHSLFTADMITEFLEDLYNKTIVWSKNGENYYIDFFKYCIWEEFLSTITVLLYYKKYNEIHDVLCHTYFLNVFGEVRPCSYLLFKNYISTIEEVCKKMRGPNYLTLTGQIAVNRIKEPIITKETLSNADLMLYQISQIYTLAKKEFGVCHYWFPITYCYHGDKQEMWVKLISKEQCKKIFPLFGVRTIDDLKSEIKKCQPNANCRHEHDYFRRALVISDSIDIDTIGSIN